jgi:hypothetical protein
MTHLPRQVTGTHVALLVQGQVCGGQPKQSEHDGRAGSCMGSTWWGVRK